MPLGKSCPGEGQFLHLTTEAPLQPRVGPECKGHRLGHSNSICGHWGAMEAEEGLAQGYAHHDLSSGGSGSDLDAESMCGKKHV